MINTLDRYFTGLAPAATADTSSTSTSATTSDSAVCESMCIDCVYQRERQQEQALLEAKAHLVHIIHRARLIGSRCALLYRANQHMLHRGLLSTLATELNFARNPCAVSGRVNHSSSSTEFGLLIERQLNAVIRAQLTRFELDGEFVDWQTTMSNLSGVRFHRLTGWLFRALDKRNWTLLAYQVPLTDGKIGLYTRLDFMAYDRDARKLILIELKTGYDRGYTSELKETGQETALPLSPIMGSRKDTYENRHMMQLAMTRHLLISSGLSAHLFDSYIVRASNRKAIGVREPVKLKRWAIDSADRLMRKLHADACSATDGT